MPRPSELCCSYPACLFFPPNKWFPFVLQHNASGGARDAQVTPFPFVSVAFVTTVHCFAGLVLGGSVPARILSRAKHVESPTTDVGGGKARRVVK